jgi:uncharacterized protein (DUF302 family)
LAPTPTKPYTMRPGIPDAQDPDDADDDADHEQPLPHVDAGCDELVHLKIKAKPGLSFDDVVESMMLRANKLNFKYVGNNLMYKDFQAVLGDFEAPRIEVHSFCDIAVGRDLLKISPEFLVFLPCRIGVMEDADKNIWVMMLDWNLEWVGGYEKDGHLAGTLQRRDRHPQEDGGNHAGRRRRRSLISACIRFYTRG